MQTEGQGVARMHMQGGCRACGGWVGRRTQMCTQNEAIPIAQPPHVRAGGDLSGDGDGGEGIGDTGGRAA